MWQDRFDATAERVVEQFSPVDLVDIGDLIQAEKAPDDASDRKSSSGECRPVAGPRPKPIHLAETG